MWTSRRRRNLPWEMHLVVIARSEKSGIFLSVVPDEAEFRESNFCAKSFGRRERLFVCRNMVCSSSIDSSWCVAHEKAESTVRNASRGHHEVPKVRHFPFTLIRWRRISVVQLLRKIVWKPRTNSIFVQTWCFAHQSTALDVQITKKVEFNVRNASGGHREVRKVRHFLSLLPDEAEFRESYFCVKLFGSRTWILYLSKHGI